MERTLEKEVYCPPQAEVAVLRLEGILCNSPGAKSGNVWGEVNE